VATAAPAVSAAPVATVVAVVVVVVVVVAAPVAVVVAVVAASVAVLTVAVAVVVAEVTAEVTEVASAAPAVATGMHSQTSAPASSRREDLALRIHTVPNSGNNQPPTPSHDRGQMTGNANLPYARPLTPPLVQERTVQ
jgi:hypothetical protein